MLTKINSKRLKGITVPGLQEELEKIYTQKKNLSIFFKEYKKEVSDIEELKNFKEPKDKDVILVENQSSLYRFDSESTQPEDGISILEADDATPGRWIEFVSYLTVSHLDMINQNNNADFQHIDLTLKNYLTAISNLIPNTSNVADINYIVLLVNDLYNSLEASKVGVEDADEFFVSSNLEDIFKEILLKIQIVIENINVEKDRAKTAEETIRLEKQLKNISVIINALNSSLILLETVTTSDTTTGGLIVAYSPEDNSTPIIIDEKTYYQKEIVLDKEYSKTGKIIVFLNGILQRELEEYVVSEDVNGKTVVTITAICDSIIRIYY